MYKRWRRWCAQRQIPLRLPGARIAPRHFGGLRLPIPAELRLQLRSDGNRNRGSFGSLLGACPREGCASSYSAGQFVRVWVLASAVRFSHISATSFRRFETTCSMVEEAKLTATRTSTTSTAPSTRVDSTSKPARGANRISSSAGYCESQPSDAPRSTIPSSAQVKGSAGHLWVSSRRRSRSRDGRVEVDADRRKQKGRWHTAVEWPRGREAIGKSSRGDRTQTSYARISSTVAACPPPPPA